MASQVLKKVDWGVLREVQSPPDINLAAWNMALDSVIFERVSVNRSNAVVRLYEWPRPAITLGRFQNPHEALNLAVCREESVDVALRPTGGRGILHGDDLTVSIAAGLEDLKLNPDASVGRIYACIGGLFESAFAALGTAVQRGGHSGGVRMRHGNCMASVTQADLVDGVTGRKMLGAALLLRNGCVLCQCTIPVNAQRRVFALLSERVFKGKKKETPTASIVAHDSARLRTSILDAMETCFGIGPTNVDMASIDWDASMRRAKELSVYPVEEPPAHN